MRNSKIMVTVVAVILFCLATDRTHATVIHKIRIDGIINPVSAQFILDAIARAEDKHAEALIIELDTPGGLLEATRDIVQEFLATDLPIIVYVSPSGARAGSAGVFITLAAHIAVMAPGTNIGAAHPVTMGGGGMPGGGEKDTTGSSVMNDKMTNDAAAMIRAIAEQRGRNIDWADSSVRESKSITATIALESGVIDFILPDIESILEKIDGKTVKVPSGEITIHTQNAIVELFEMDWKQLFFDKLSDPNIAYILMMLGVYGMIYELSNPGAIFPGIVGGICLLLAFLAFQTLPINTVGVLLMVFGILLLLLEIKVPSYGLLTIGGATSLALGSVILIDTSIPVLKVSLGIIIPTVILTVLFALFAVGLGIKAQRKKTTTGKEGIIGMVGEALEDLNPQGQILVNGEYWNGISKQEIKKGQHVEVTGMQGLKLIVKQVPPPEI